MINSSRTGTLSPSFSSLYFWIVLMRPPCAGPVRIEDSPSVPTYLVVTALGIQVLVTFASGWAPWPYHVLLKGKVLPKASFSVHQTQDFTQNHSQQNTCDNSNPKIRGNQTNSISKS